MHEVLKEFYDELNSVQFIDNTPQEAIVAKLEVRDIMHRLATRLTMLALDGCKCEQIDENTSKINRACVFHG